jgi:ubiquinone/menaquinone biosynthesis C-methylase UbiE
MASPSPERCRTDPRRCRPVRCSDEQPGAGKYPWPVFSPEGPSLRELARQALCSVDGGYDLLAPKFDHTPFRTPDDMLDATAGALRPLGPFGRGLDVCCGTGAGMRVLTSLCQGPVTGTDFSAGMLARARSGHPGVTWVRADARALPFAGAFDLAVSFGALGHFLPAERPTLFAGVYRALRSGGVFAFPIGGPQPISSRGYWAPAGFDLAMRIRNAVWRPPFVMYYRTCLPHAVRNDLTASRFTVTTLPLYGARPARRRQPAVPACPRAQTQHALTPPTAGWQGLVRFAGPHLAIFGRGLVDVCVKFSGGAGQAGAGGVVRRGGG